MGPVFDSAASNGIPQSIASEAICQGRMRNAIEECKWTRRELHDAVLSNGLVIISLPNLVLVYVCCSNAVFVFRAACF